MANKRKLLYSCMICEKIMIDPCILPTCQCQVCHFHIEKFEKITEKLWRCGSCKEEIPVQSLGVNKKIKSAIEDECHLDKEEKKLKGEYKQLLDDLTVGLQGLQPKEHNYCKVNSSHFEKMRKKIDDDLEYLIQEMRKKAELAKSQTSQIENEIVKKLKNNGNELKSLSFDVNKQNSILDDLYRSPNVPKDLIHENNKQLEKHFEKVQQLEKNFKNSLLEISSISFDINKSLIANESFGTLKSNVNQSLCIIDEEKDSSSHEYVISIILNYSQAFSFYRIKNID